MKIRKITSAGVLIAICVLFFPGCNNDDGVQDPITPAPVTAVELTVDKPNFTGACPHTFKLSGIVTSSGPGIAAYSFRYAFTDDFDSSIVKGAINFDGAGSQTIPLELVVSETAAYDLVLDAGTISLTTSNQIEVNATCS